jgi:GT2 family glycosyltransferase
MKKPLAPIILFVYNRPEHTRKCLEKLSEADLAGDSILYIFADGVKQNATEAQRAKTAAVRKLIYEKKWCGEVFITEREENFGLARSVRSGTAEIAQKHGKIIVLEDDLAVEKGFLKYMNTALEWYENEKNVFGISGFGHPLADYSAAENSFFLPIPCSWGWATWSRVIEKFVAVEENLIKKAVEEKNIHQKNYNFGEYYFFEILLAQLAGKIDSWAAIFHADMFLSNGLFLFPKYSLVKNIGFDAEGTHTHEDDFFSKTHFTEELSIKKLPPALSPSSFLVEKAFRKHFGKKSLWRRVINKLAKIFRT